MRVPTLAVLIFLSMGAHGAPIDAQEQHIVHVSLSLQSELSPALAGNVVFRSVMGPQAIIETPVGPVKQPTDVKVAAGTMWEVSLAARGWWAAPVVVSVQDADVMTTLTLLPTGSVTGHFIPPSGNAPPPKLKVKLDVPPGAKSLPGPPTTETQCEVSIADASFQCDVPAGTLDLSLHAPGYVPAYRWGVKVSKSAKEDLGAVLLSKGSSVVGFVALAQAKLEAHKGKVALFLETAGVNATAFRLSRPVAESAITERGFFQIPDVRPGRYVAVASYPGFASASVSPVNVFAGVETKIRHAIELQRPITLTLRAEPPRDFSGNPWHIEVMRASPVTGTFIGAPIYEGETKDGSVVLRDQQAGRYRVEIGDSNGNPYVADEFATSGTADDSRTFKIQSLRIRGSVHLGDHPLTATLWFGGRFGELHVAMSSDADGNFRGVLPRDGAWKVLVSADGFESELDTNVEKKDDDAAVVELRIPGNHLNGVVVDSSGAAIGGAKVSLGAATMSVQVRTNNAGAFHFEGVPPGPIRLGAYREDENGIRNSDPLETTIAETESLDGVTLKLKDAGPSIHGRVLGRDGPVVGAGVTIVPGTGFDGAPYGQASTGIDGVFDAHVAPGFGRALIQVSAPGYPFRVFDVAIDGHAITLSMPQVGGALDVTLPKDPGPVLLVFQDDRYVDGNTLFNWARTHGEPFVHESTLHVSDVAAGRYRVCASIKGKDGQRCADGFLAPYGELRLTIQ